MHPHIDLVDSGSFFVGQPNFLHSRYSKSLGGCPIIEMTGEGENAFVKIAAKLNTGIISMTWSGACELEGLETCIQVPDDRIGGGGDLTGRLVTGKDFDDEIRGCHNMTLSYYDAISFFLS